MLKLTQCLIVKNEEKNLPRALEWGKAHVDEQLVVDTGSTDGTAALAEELGARVLHYTWENDFAAARNFAIPHCSGDWIVFLDADEYFEKADAALLRPLIERIDAGAAAADGGRRYNVIETPWVNVGSGGISRQARIFRNVPYLRYEGAVHERLRALGGESLEVYAVHDRPAIYHTGYVWSTDNSREAKGKRNFEAARAALEKSPDCALYQLYAAEALEFTGELEEAGEYFEIAMRNADSSIPAARLREGYRQWLSLFNRMGESGLSSKLLHDAVWAYNEAALHFPDEPDYDILITQLYLLAGDAKSAVRAFSAALTKKGGGRLAEKLKAADSGTFERLAEACRELKRQGFI